MQEQATEGRRPFPVSFGHIVCAFAVVIGVLMLVAAVWQNSHPTLDSRAVGTWQSSAAGGYPTMAIDRIELNADGTGRYGPNKSFDNGGATFRLRWHTVDTRLTIEVEGGYSPHAVAHGSRFTDDSFLADDGTEFHKG